MNFSIKNYWSLAIGDLTGTVQLKICLKINVLPCIRLCVWHFTLCTQGFINILSMMRFAHELKHFLSCTVPERILSYFHSWTNHLECQVTRTAFTQTRISKGKWMQILTWFHLIELFAISLCWLIQCSSIHPFIQSLPPLVLPESLLFLGLEHGPPTKCK